MTKAVGPTHLSFLHSSEKQSPFLAPFLGTSPGCISDRLDAWQEELKCDKDKSFLIDGITNGFRLSDEGCEASPVETRNHKSALEHREKVEKEIINQLQKGNYVLAEGKPTIVSPLGAIPKEDGDIRLIHDASLPKGASMNDYATLQKVKFQSLEDACKLAKPDYFCAKIDLKSAYRSVAIHRDDYKMTGLQWKFQGQEKSTFIFDSKVPFGSRRGPSIFHRLSQAVKRCMQRRGYNDVVVYIDDFLIIAPTFDRCNEALHTLIRLVRKLGFSISWPKVVGPTQKITFLGVDIDTVSSTLSLGADKLGKLKEQLSNFYKRKRASKLQLQQLAGLLNWATSAVRGGKFFLRRILDSMTTLQHARHKVRLCQDFKRDVSWWLTYLDRFNGVVYFDEQARERVHVDACPTAAGGFWQGNWRYSVFHCDIPAAASLHITHKETLAAIEAVKCWAPHWRGKTVVIHTDNTTAKCAINRGRSRSKLVNRHLRNMFWICAKYDCRVIAVSVSGVINILADTISRLHEPGNLVKLSMLLANWSAGHRVRPLFISPSNMSSKSFSFLMRSGRTRR